MTNRNLMVAMGTGAALAFMADPVSGRRRRALVRDKVVRATHKTRDAFDATMRDMANRTRGIRAATLGRRSNGAADTVDDAVLLERVRAKLGRFCSHPRAIDVYAARGVITLSGPILKGEHGRVIRMARRVDGVEAVIDQLEPHADATGIPSLQGRGHVPGSRIDLFQRNWAPATQALVAAAGIAATGACLAAYNRQ